ASWRCYGSTDGFEDMWRSELVHRNGEPLLGAGEEGLQFAPAGFRANADSHVHLFLHERQIRGIQLLVAASLGGTERDRLFAANQFFKSSHRTLLRQAERDC